MKSEQFLKEGFVEDAHEMHVDHEVQMAREECYHAAENAIHLHKLLRHVSEQQGLEGWVSAKITLANDYLKTVREYLEYELMAGGTEGHEQPVEMLATPVENEILPVAEGKTLAEGAMKRQMEADAERMELEQFLERWAHSPEDQQWVTEFWNSINGVTEMDKSGPQPGRDGRVSHSTYGSRDKGSPYKGPDVHLGPEHMLKKKDVNKAGVRALNKAFANKKDVTETSAGSVATVVNPAGKNKAKVGTLFGGTYKQSKTKAK